MKRLFAFILLVSLIWSFSFVSYQLDRQIYSPGDKGIATLTLSLSHPLEAGESLEEFRGVNVQTSGLSTSTIYLGDMDQGQATFSIAFSIPSDVPSGVYYLNVKATGTAVVYSGNEKKMDVDVASLAIPIMVVREPKLSVEVEPYVISERSNVVVKVCNSGGKAKDISLTLSNGVSLVNGAAYFDAINSNSCANKTVEVDSNAEGRITAYALLMYKDELGLLGNATLSIPLVVDKSTATISLSQLNAIPSEKEGIIKLSISNKGNDATDIHITPGEGLSFTGKSDASIDELKAGERKIIEEKVYTRLPPGVHKITFRVRWKEEGKEKVESIEVPIVVSAQEGLGVYLEAEPSPLRENQRSTLSVIVANKAGYEINALTIKLESSDLELLDISNERFIGSLESDDFSSEQFNVIPRRKGKGTVKITLTYKDPSGKELNETRELPITVYSSVENTNYTLIGVAAIIVIVGAAYYYIRYRRKRK